MIAKVLNAVAYQAVWLASVAGASRGLAWAGPLAAALFATGVLASRGQRRADLRLLPYALLIGFAADSAWIALGWLDYGAAWPSASFAPAWILGLWISLALTLNHSMAVFKRRLALASALGAVGGPLAYWGAAQAGAVRIVASPTVVLAGLCIAWAVVFPLLAWLADRGSAAVAAAPARGVAP